jgi:hypothetical protein
MESKGIGFYFINLDGRKDRLESFSSQFVDSSLSITRIAAISFSELVLNEEDSPAGVIACWKSHQKVYEFINQSDCSHAVIFEDDAEVSADLIKWLENLGPGDLKGIDLFQFGYATSKNKLDFIEFDPSPFGILDLRKYIGVELSRIDLVYRNWIKASRFLVLQILQLLLKFSRFLNDRHVTKILKYSNFLLNERKLRFRLKTNQPLIYHSFEAGAHAYIIGRELAKLLIDFNNPVLLPTDVCLMGVARAKNFRFLRSSKSMSEQSGSFSSIAIRTRI